MYTREWSARDIEGAFRDLHSGRELLGKEAVNELTEELLEEYEQFFQRGLSGCDVLYLFTNVVFKSRKPIK